MKLSPDRFFNPQPASQRADVTPKYLSSSQGTQDDGTWMITLCDLTFLLLGFMVVWYVSGNKETAPQAKPAVTVTTAQKTQPLVPPKENRLNADEWHAVREEMETYVDKLGLKSEVRVESGQSEILISLADTVPFASGKADLRSRALPVMEKVAAIALSQGALQLEVRGHTDDRPISTAEFPSNWELSAARASRVARYLIEKGVHPSRIAIEGFANHRPRVANSNPRSRRENRRVEIRLYQNAEAPVLKP
jgi:chemotaxis protein MotB